MARIAQYDVFNSNSNGKSKACVRVKHEGIILAELWSDHSNPLKWLRCRPLSEERVEFVRQLTLCGVSSEDVQMLLKLPPKQAK